MSQTTKYLVEVCGSNGSPARIGRWDDQVYAHTSGRLDWCAAVVYPHGLADRASASDRDRHPRAPYWSAKGVKIRRVALFRSREAAERAVEDGELWNGQSCRVRHARGEQLREGVLIESY